MEIKINDGKPNAVINDIANQLNVEVNYTSKNVSTLCLPKNIGEGCIEQRNYRGGISVVDVRVYLNEEIELNYNQGLLHPLKILINKKGRIKHQFHDKKEPEYLNEHGVVALASIAHQNHTIFLPKNQQLSILSVRINRRKFEDYVEEFVPNMDKNLSLLLRDVNGVNSYFFETYYDYTTSRIIERYFQSKYNNIVESLYLQGLTFQLIGIQLNLISENYKLSNDEKTISYSNSEKIIKASKIIKSDISKFTTVTNLAQEIGISVKKLQEGFNKLFGTSVLEFVTNHRLILVKSMLLETDLTISEICYKLGVNSPSYMSKIFKEKFGISPKEYRKNK